MTLEVQHDAEIALVLALYEALKEFFKNPQGIITNLQKIINTAIMIYEYRLHRKCYKNLCIISTMMEASTGPFITHQMAALVFMSQHLKYLFT